MAKAKKNDKPLKFEKALEELAGIVEELERGELGLDESLAAYEKGVKALKACQDILARAERRIAVLSGQDAEGNPIVEPLEEADDATASGADTEEDEEGGEDTSGMLPF